MRSKTVGLTILILTTCGSLLSCLQEKPEQMTMNYSDQHTYARPDAIVKHLDWDVTVDFDEQKISGVAHFKIETQPGASQLILDVKNLDIERVAVGNDRSPAEFSLGPFDQHMGQALTIPIDAETKTVRVHYHTTEGAEALQWLDPVQTADQTHPFLFTQSQAILARSWIPIQDSPGIRLTYSARVKVPPGLMALMSAGNPTSTSETGEYHFTMDQPIPAYLMALAVGKVNFAPVGERTGLYAEPSVVDRALYEFGEMEAMLIAAEGLYGPYRWERYDLLILPPSFPFGGMENPRLTFTTPTILAGDRSLTSLIAHELAHSWSGNLVTNATWDDFWLNEGFTVYFEQRIMEQLYGRSYSEMLASLSKDGLEKEIEQLVANGQPNDTKLKLDLAGRNPDDGVTAVPYDKGYLFLRLLEEQAGRETFDAFLKKYFSENSFQVINTEQFLDYLQENLFKANQLGYDSGMINAWVYGQGLPANCPEPQSDRFQEVENKLHAMIGGALASSIETKQWSTHEWLFFIRSIPDGTSSTKMAELDQAFGFTHSGNSEISMEWLKKAIINHYQPAYPRLEEFLVGTGRRKFLRPLYTELAKTAEGKKMARAIYQKARPNYHSVSANTIDELLGR